MDLEGSRAPFGRGLERVLGGVWQHWRALRPFFGVIFSCLYLGWSSKGLLEASGLDFNWILGGLEGILGGFGEGFGRDLEALGASWAVFFPHSSCLYLEWSSKALLEASGLDFD